MPKDDRPKICGVWVYSSQIGDGDTYHRVGTRGVTKIEFGKGCGLTGYFDTVMVYRNDKLMSEHPFHNCLGIDYFVGQPDPDEPF